MEAIFCSIGENCLGQGILDRLKIPSIVTPFSWARSNIDYTLEVIREDFSDFLNPAYLQHRHRYAKNITTNSKYQTLKDVFDTSVSSEFEFTHHDILSSIEAHKSVVRKIARFRTEIYNSDRPIVLFYHYRYTRKERQNITYVQQQLEKLRLFIEAKRSSPVKVVGFTQNLVDVTEERTVAYEQYGDLIFAKMSTQTIWAGNDPDILWGKVDDDLFTDVLSNSISRLNLSYVA